MIKHLENFIEKIQSGKVEVYNEFSLQHELGIFLREILKKEGYKVEFERNIRHFEIFKTVKKEIDIVIYKEDNKGNKKDKYAIELKFPRKGQYPEQMYSFVKDIMFMEQLKNNGFKKTYCMTLVDDAKFYSNEGRLKTDGIYRYFRSVTSMCIPTNEEINRPTGKKDENENSLILIQDHVINWKKFENTQLDKWRYYLIEI